MAEFNIAEMGVDSAGIAVRAWYGGSSSDRNAVQCVFFCDGSSFDVVKHSGSKNWTTPIVSITGLRADTRYKFYAVFYNSDYDVIGRTQTISIWTAPLKDPPSTPGFLRSYAKTENSISVKWGISDNAHGYDIYLDGQFWDSTDKDSMTVTGLRADTSYKICVSAYNDYGESNTRCIITSTPAPPDTTDPEIWNVVATASKVSGNTFNVTVTWSASDNDGIDYQWAYRSPPNSASYTSIGSTLSRSTRSYTFTTDANGNSFLGGNRYYFRIRVIDYAGNMSPTADGTVSLLIPLGRPANWEWEYTITSGGKFYSQSADGKTAYLMRAAHWNAFTTRINEFRDYKGLSSYTFTTATTSTTSTGVRNCINQAINAINPMLSTSQRMNTIGVGDKVTAKIFTDLVAKIKLIT